MKNVYLIISLVLALSFLLMPLLAVENKQSTVVSSADTASTESKVESAQKKLDSFSVFLSDSKQTITLTSEEYLTGVLACEMPLSYTSEALKAQALAAYTFAYRRHLEKSADSEYDLTTDSTLDQGYLSKEQRKEKWGDQADANEKKALEAIQAVAGKIIVYEKQPILAVYHAISPGNTETAENMWGSKYPYLVAQRSVGDLLAPDYLSEVAVTAENFSKKLSALGCNVSGEPQSYIGAVKKSDSGTVLQITLCGKIFTGAEIRKAFSLRSAAFDLSFRDNGFAFSVMGYGHGVGMSQFGANYMAQQGSSCAEIIAAYYKGVQIVDVK